MKCRFCGCTDMQACAGGCSWAAPEICSQCVNWRDEIGPVRVLAVADGYAMLRRRRRNPFIASIDQMLRGDYGWHRVAA